MSMSGIQREISKIAYDLANRGETMTMSELSNELNNRGFEPGEGRGLYRQVSTTYARALEEGNSGIAENIADCFTNDSGEYCWK